MVRTSALIAPTSMGSAMSSTSKDLDALLLHDEHEGTAAPAAESARRGQDEAVGGRVDRAGHAGGAIRVWDPVPGRQEAGRVDDPRRERPTGRLCLGRPRCVVGPSPRNPTRVCDACLALRCSPSRPSPPQSSVAAHVRRWDQQYRAECRGSDFSMALADWKALRDDDVVGAARERAKASAAVATSRTIAWIFIFPIAPPPLLPQRRPRRRRTRHSHA
jgi:hypothetical protein